ncbi:MAG: hypothetical protein R3E65_09175 [Steroidobacteraceae bacterium]
MMLPQRTHRAAQLDHQSRGRDRSDNGFVKVPVGREVALADALLPIQVPGEDLGVLVERAILDHGARFAGEVEVQPILAHEEPQLRLEGPALHVGIEVGKVGVGVVRLEEGAEVVLLAQEARELGLARADVAGDRDVA